MPLAWGLLELLLAEVDAHLAVWLPHVPVLPAVKFGHGTRR